MLTSIQFPHILLYWVSAGYFCLYICGYTQTTNMKNTCVCITINICMYRSKHQHRVIRRVGSRLHTYMLTKRFMELFVRSWVHNIITKIKKKRNSLRVEGRKSCFEGFFTSIHYISFGSEEYWFGIAGEIVVLWGGGVGAGYLFIPLT